MSVTDYFLNSLVKYLQKKQKKRKKEKQKAKKAARKRKKKRVKKKLTKKPSTRISKKLLSRRKKKVTRPKKKKVPRKIPKKAKKKSLIKKKPKKKTIKPIKELKQVNEVRVGEVTHFFSGIKVIVLKMTSGKLLIGEKIHLKGRKTDFVQQVKSLQIESEDVKVARKGQLVGLKVNKKAKEGDQVFKIG